MKTAISFVCIVFLLSCAGRDNSSEKEAPVINADEIVVTFNKEARFYTFVTSDGRAVSGTVVKKLKNGGLNTWEVENGLATQQIMYYPNGQVERLVELKNGNEHGKFLMFYSDGTKYLEQHYENGEPVGTWYRWTKDGELAETIEH